MLTTYTDTPPDEELRQAKARVVLVCVILIALLTVSFNLQVMSKGIIISSGYLVFSLLWLGIVKLLPNRLLGRRYIPIVGDLLLAAVAMYGMNSYGVLVYPLFLWIIVSNGLYFGSRQLLVAMLVGSVGFASVVSSASYWQANMPVGLGLLVGMIVLSLLLYKAINRLQNDIQRAQFAATHDPVSGVFNRAFFLNRLEHEVGRSERYGDRFCIFYIDLDNFKQLNKRHGHRSGDKMLAMTAERLLTVVRNTDIVARVGGNEFAVLGLALSDPTAIEQLSTKLEEAVRAPIEMDGKTIEIVARIVISAFPTHGTTVSTLLHAIDHAMSCSKQSAKTDPLPFESAA